MKPAGCLRWDSKDLAAAMKLPEADVREYFTDGRRVAFIVERRLAYEFLSGRRSISEGADHDLVGPDGGRWEVRSISRQGTYFCPSFMVGSGRSFVEAGFLAKLDAITGYIICDIESFPEVPFWVVGSNSVRNWWASGQLGRTSKISRAAAVRLLAELGVEAR